MKASDLETIARLTMETLRALDRAGAFEGIAKALGFTRTSCPPEGPKDFDLAFALHRVEIADAIEKLLKGR